MTERFYFSHYEKDYVTAFVRELIDDKPQSVRDVILREFDSYLDAIDQDGDKQESETIWNEYDRQMQCRRDDETHKR